MRQPVIFKTIWLHSFVNGDLGRCIYRSLKFFKFLLTKFHIVTIQFVAVIKFDPEFLPATEVLGVGGKSV